MKSRTVLYMALLVCTCVQLNAQDLNWNTVSYTSGSLSRNFGVIGNPPVSVSMNITGYTAGLPGGSPAKYIATPQAGAGTTCTNFCALRCAPTFSNPATQSLVITFTFSPAIAPLTFALYDIDGAGAFIDSVRVTASGASGARAITMTNVDPTTSFIYGSGTTTAIVKGGTGNNTDAQTNVSVAGFVTTLVITFMGQGSFSIGNMSWTGTIVPVKWVSFTGNKQNDGTVKLHWATANEQNAADYKIEKSTDGITYQVIGEIPAAGKDKNEYFFVDANPGTGNNFYRIKQVDIDQRFEYSSVVLIRNSEFSDQELTIFPNPVIKTLTISSAGNTQFQNMQIIDAIGRPVRNYSNTGNQLDVNDLKPGLYYLRAENKSGLSFKKYFLKQ